MHTQFYLRIVLLATAAFVGIANSTHAEIITTADGSGADARVRLSLPNSNYGASEFVAIQNGDLTHARKTYLRFDLSSLGGIDVSAAELQLTPNTPLSVGAGVTFNLFGLSDLDAGESWNEATITWNNAPANDTLSNTAVTSGATSLGLFSFTSDFQEGVPIGFSSTSIRDFLNADTNNLVTFILTGPQTAGSLNYTFGSKENTDEYPIPTLQVSPVPEPSSFIVMGALILSCWGMGRLRLGKRGLTGE